MKTVKKFKKEILQGVLVFMVALILGLLIMYIDSQFTIDYVLMIAISAAAGNTIVGIILK